MKINYLKTKILTKVGSLPLAGLLLVNKVFAQTPTNPQAQSVGITDIPTVIDRLNTIVIWVQYIFFLVAILYIILAAFSYLTSGGDETKITAAKNRLMYAVIAIVVALLAFVLKDIIQNFLG